jgi:Na+/proline symporter
VLGYIIGYVVIAYVLLPLYYKRNLTSIYNYLLQRFGFTSYKTGAMFFIISRTFGATARLYLVINVLQIFILDSMGVPFWATTLVILLMILLYTFEGGVRTIVFTDTLQTSFMLIGLIVCLVYIMTQMNFSLGETMQALGEKNYSRVINTDVNSAGFFLKQILGGMFITIAMTGLDQEMMQKNISVNTLKDSQKNVLTLSILQGIVVLLFLVLGGLLYLYAANIPGFPQEMRGDNLFPEIALNYLPPIIGVIFIIGLISALFPSADGALTALTSSFCIDIIGLKRREDWSEAERKRIRLTVHFTFAIVFLICIMVFKFLNNKSIIDIILRLAGYTYGPLLGLFSFGILTKRKFKESVFVPVICLLAPLITYVIAENSKTIFGGFQIGIELLILNGLLTFIGLFLISKKSEGVYEYQNEKLT